MESRSKMQVAFIKIHGFKYYLIIERRAMSSVKYEVKGYTGLRDNATHFRNIFHAQEDTAKLFNGPTQDFKPFNF